MLFGSKIRHQNEGEMIVSHQNLRPSRISDEALEIGACEVFEEQEGLVQR
jgi:hypothetical protein